MSTTSTNILDSDQNDQQKIHRNLISFYVLGLFNVFLFSLIVENGIFREYHELLFFPAVPFAIIKIFPLFILNF